MNRDARAKDRRSQPAGGPGQQSALEAADRLHSAAIHVLRRVRREDSASGLPGPQLSALSVVVFRGPITLGALADAEQVRPPSMTRVVQALETAGLVERRVDERDRRSTWIASTPLGERLLQEGRLRRVQALAAAIEALSEEEQAALAAGLNVLERIAIPGV